MKFLIYLMLLFSFVANAGGITKIAPTEAEAGHPFTIIDTSQGRLVDGTIAVFRLAGLEVTLPLRTHKPFKTAQSRLASDMYSGVYTVFVRQPNGTEIEIGYFTVYGATAPPPTISPDVGAPGAAFTIADPLARIHDGDLALFYATGADPIDGVPATNVSISPNGMSLSGNVPSAATQGVQNFVTVRPITTADSRFGDLAFFVTVIAHPSIEPIGGDTGTAFTIVDPYGRMEADDVVLFYAEGVDPAAEGTPADNIAVSADGRTLTGNVPGGLPPGLQHYVAVRDSPSESSKFGDLAFMVTLDSQTPFIVPSTGSTATAFTIVDPLLGRMEADDVVLFYAEGVDPAAQGRPADNIAVSADGRTLTGNVPGGLAPTIQHYVAVRDSPSALSKFGDLAFMILP